MEKYGKVIRNTGITSRRSISARLAWLTVGSRRTVLPRRTRWSGRTGRDRKSVVRILKIALNQKYGISYNSRRSRRSSRAGRTLWPGQISHFDSWLAWNSHSSRGAGISTGSGWPGWPGMSRNA